jgi:hypothetical protein
VDDDPGRVQDAAQAGRAGPLELLERALGEVARLLPGAYRFTRARERGPGGGDRERPGRGGEALVAEQLVDRGKVAQSHVEGV